MNANEKDRLHRDLVKLGDMMADGLHYEEPWISKEYKKITKLLYPEAYPIKKKKPSRQILKTMLNCTCGNIGWTFTRYPTNKIGFGCKNCGKNTGECITNSEARDKWNNIINNGKIC